MTDETLQKLKMAFANSFTDEEACIYADISTTSFYNYCKKHPEFVEKKQLLKKSPNLKAKQNIIKSMNEGNIKDSQWRLERKAKDEFSLRTENAVTIDENPLEDLDAKEKKQDGKE